MSAAEEATANPLVVFKHQADARVPEFEAALPAHIPAARFVRVLMTAIQNNPELLQCDRRSVFNAAMRAAQDGLLPDGRFGAIVVRRDSKSSTGKSANWQVMVAGIRQKARNSGEISTWDAHIVRAGDHFQFQLGDNPQINHTYDLKTKRGDIIGAYSVAILKDGSKSYELMSIDEIHEIRDRSDAWKAFKSGYIKSTPWSTDDGEMCRKTVARRHSKVLPMSSDLDDLIRRDDPLYDMEGAGDERHQRKHGPRPTLADAMDRLASGTPRLAQEPAEAASPLALPVDDGADAGAGGAEVAGPASGAAQASEEPSGADVRGDLLATQGDPVEAAYAAGRAAHGSGVSRRACPPEMRDPARQPEAAAWQAGWDAGKGDAS